MRDGPRQRAGHTIVVCGSASNSDPAPIKH
jgi:hypothetical protein